MVPLSSTFPTPSLGYTADSLPLSWKQSPYKLEMAIYKLHAGTLSRIVTKLVAIPLNKQGHLIPMSCLMFDPLPRMHVCFV